MAEQSPRDPPAPPNLSGVDTEDVRTAQRGRPELIIAFGVVALVALIFGFLLGLLF